MSIKIWNPFQEIERLENDIKKAFDSSVSSSGLISPLTDILETDNSIVINLNVPGVKAEDINIDATSEYLEINTKKSSENKDEKKDENWTAIHIERSERAFHRKIFFNVPVDPNNAKVHLENGVLNVTLPKHPNAKKIQLKIE